MRKDGKVTYLHGDHLGSASLATDASGARVSAMRYTPFGETRVGDAPTDRRFTGQREEAGIGLYDYGARFYSASLGRFISADTIVPQANDPQDFNRYSYVSNNPCNYIDPSGHCGSYKGAVGDGNTCTSAEFYDVEHAQQFLDAVNAYLWVYDYDYDTTWEWIRDQTVGELKEQAVAAIAAKLGVSEAIAGWIAMFAVSGVDEANTEGLKTFRWFRDDLESAVTTWQGWRNNSTGGISLRISVDRVWGGADLYLMDLYGGDSAHSEMYSHSAGGPFWGALNNFGASMSNLMISYIPSITGGFVGVHDNTTITWWGTESHWMVYLQPILPPLEERSFPQPPKKGLSPIR